MFRLAFRDHVNVSKRVNVLLCLFPYTSTQRTKK